MSLLTVVPLLLLLHVLLLLYMLYTPLPFEVELLAAASGAIYTP